MKKKGILSVGIAAVICVLALMFTTIMASANPFKDVPETAWYHDSVLYANDKGLMKGVADDKFGPNDPMSRAMIVTVLHRMEGEPSAPASKFKDVPEGTWFSASVAWAAENGIVNGKSTETFDPNGDVTREQIAAILYRYAGTKGYDVSKKADLTGFSDNNKISPYARDALAWANANKLVNGMGDNILSPGTNATRAQVAAIFQRFCENIAKPTDDKPDDPDDPDNQDPLPLPDDPSEADTYYWENSEKVLSVEDVETSDDVLTEDEAVAMLADRGFGDGQTTYDYSLAGEYVEEAEAEDGNATKHPMYECLYVTESGNAWNIFIVGNDVFANPIFYNLESNLESETLVSESKTLTSYDDETNKYYVTVPASSGAIVKTVERIDADTLDRLTIEEIDRL